MTHDPLPGTRGSGDWSVRGRVSFLPLVLGGCGIGAGLTSHAEIVSHLVVCVATMLGVFQTINSLWWRVRLDHWNCPKLRRFLRGEAVIGAGGMFALAVIAHLAGSDGAALTAMTFVLAPIWLWYRRIQEEIFRIIEEEQELEHSRAAITPRGRRWSSQTEGGKGPIRAFVAKLLHWHLMKHVSRTRTHIATAIASLLILTSTCSAGLMASPTTYHERVKGFGADAITTFMRAATPPAASSGILSHDAAPPLAPSHDKRLLQAWDLDCRWRPGAHPDDGDVIEDERRLLDALYLGGPGVDPAKVDDPPGAAGGCTGPVHVSKEGRTRFVYVIGRDKDEKILSVAVVSRQFGPAMFIAPAAKPVLDLIAIYHDIGGMRRIDAGSGQIYGVPTPFGTALLVRPTVVQAGPSRLAVPYVALVPGAVSAWFKIMDDLRIWLWPIAAGSEGAASRINLVSNLAMGEARSAIFVDPVKHRARVSGQTSMAGPFGAPITAAELARRVEKAP